MKKVIHLMPFYEAPIEARFHEIETQLEALMVAQQAAGWQVELIMAGRANSPRLKERAEKLRGLQIAVTLWNYPLQGWPGLTAMRRWVRWVRLVRYLREQPVSLIHTHMISPHAVGLGMAAWRAGGGVLVNSFYATEPWFVQGSSRWLLQGLDRATRRTLAANKALQGELILNVGLSPSRTRALEGSDTAAQVLALYDEALGTAPPSELQNKRVA